MCQVAVLLVRRAGEGKRDTWGVMTAKGAFPNMRHNLLVLVDDEGRAGSGLCGRAWPWKLV